MKSDRKIFFENLDGLRFFSFLSVFLFHSFYTESILVQQNKFYLFLTDRLFENGNLGVNFFFVLSGFLITFLLIEEKEKTGKINVVSFWVRRILRIWPLFYFAVFFGFYIFPFLKSLFGQVPNETANIEYYLLFLNNFDFIKNGLPDASILGVLWSVAIEEQFYFIWPMILYFFPVKKYWVPFMIIISLSIVFRSVTDSNLLNEHHTLSCIGDMAIGAFGAWLIRKEKFKCIVENSKRYQIIIIYILFALIFLYRKEMFFDNSFLRIIERPIISLVILFIILEQNFSKKSFYKMSNFKTISKLGVITYGLYCLHFIGILITLTLMRILKLDDNLFNVIIVETLFSFLITIIVSKVSYRYFESPFLKLKERFAYIMTR